MVAEPILRPVTIGCVAGVVDPARIVTEAGETVTFEVSLLARLTIVPPAGAGAESVTTRAAD